MRRIVSTILLVLAPAALTFAQTLNEINAAQAGNAALDSGSASGGLDAARLKGNAQSAANAASAQTGALPGGAPTAQVQPGIQPLGTVPNPSAGFAPAPAGNLPGVPGAPAVMPGIPTVGAVATPAAAFPGLSAPTTFAPAVGGAPGVPGQAATPTPLPTIRVLAGVRVYDAVSGALLEDAVQIPVPQTDQDKYLDDGVHDNGIANDGIRGNVVSIKDKFIGAETNVIKNRLINVVRRGEDLSPMHFFRYHVMTMDPTDPNPKMPRVLEKEQQRDEALRDWNNKFLADFRIDKNDPKSEFYQLYVPKPPQQPRYPVPPGYMAPQKLEGGATAGPGGVPATPTPNIFNGDSVF